MADAGKFWVLGRFVGSKSHLRRLSNGLVSVLSMEKGVFFPRDFERERLLVWLFSKGLAVRFAAAVGWLVFLPKLLMHCLWVGNGWLFKNF